MITQSTRGAVLAAGLLLAACAHEEAYQKPKTPVNVQEAAVAAGSAPLRYSAAMLPAQRVDVAFKIPGYVAGLGQARGAAGRSRPLQEGDTVRKGDVLARIRQEDVTAKLNQARSQVAEADAALAQAKQAWDRASSLYERKSLTRPDYDAAKAAYDTVQARRDGARALVAEAQNAMADSVLRAPLDGVVVKRLVEVGSLVGPGTPGYVIVDTSSVKLMFGVPDAVLRTMPRGAPVTISTEVYPDARFEGHVSSVAPAADPGSLVFDVEVTVPNRDGRLKPGMVGAIDVTGSEAPRALTVPLSGIVRSKTHPDGYAVYVIEDRDGTPRAKLRDVTLGAMVGNSITVTAGLRPGERVIVTGATIVTDGDAVEILQ